LNDSVPLGLLFVILLVLLAVAAALASSETALLSLNRYRLRHLARSRQRSARLAESVLQNPDRLIGLILLLRHAVHVAAAAVVTVIALRIGGALAIVLGLAVLTIVAFVICELVPKTLGALDPLRFALPAAYVYYPLLKVAAPIVLAMSSAVNTILRLLGIRGDEIASHSMSTEELRSVVAEAGVMMPRRHRRMLLSILDLEGVTVDDVMIPRQEIVGLDLDRPWEDNLALIQDSQHHRLPVYREDIDNLLGVVIVLHLLPELARGTLTEASLLQKMREPNFVPEGTPLNKALLNFQQSKRRSAFVVDEYGDVQGLITTQDIIREIVGELGSEPTPIDFGITQEADRSYVVDASANVRQLNRLMNWNFPTNGPKTLNGLIVEQLEMIPESGTGVTVAEYPIEIIDSSEHGIKRVRVFPPGSRLPAKEQAA
jgi:Mg2+/Co2+ transporter CorB